MVKSKFLWAILIVYFLVTFTLPLVSVPPFLYAGLLVLLGCTFSLTHGYKRYKKGMFVFVGLCLLISNILENLSIQTWFPFGHYYYTDLLGPKLFNVPLLIGPAYFSTGYLSWTIGNILLDFIDKRLSGFNLFALPIIASFIMVMWDVVMDPSSSTIGHYWIWQGGGGFFGVPLTNFLGWFLTVYIFFQSFAFYLKKSSNLNKKEPPKSYWYQATLFYLIIGLSFVMNLFIDHGGMVADPTGYLWNIHFIRESALTLSLYTMCFVSILALVRLKKQRELH